MGRSKAMIKINFLFFILRLHFLVFGLCCFVCLFLFSFLVPPRLPSSGNRFFVFVCSCSFFCFFCLRCFFIFFMCFGFFSLVEGGGLVVLPRFEVFVRFMQ